jgi:hypothetical protein
MSEPENRVDRWGFIVLGIIAVAALVCAAVFLGDISVQLQKIANQLSK